MTDNATRDTDFFFVSLADATKQVLSQLAGSELAVELETAIPTEVALAVPFAAEGSLAGTFSLRFASADVRHAASLLMGEEPDDSTPVTEDRREAAVELARQICGSFASALRSRFGPLELRNDDSLELGVTGVNARQLTINAGGRSFSLQVALAQELAQSLQENEERLNQNRDERVPDESANDKAESTIGSSNASTGRKFQDSNLDLLLDLELPVTLRFGSRQMLLKDVLELTSGSVVELDRRVREPVDLLIDDKLIARGEVVLIEGNYGVRVLAVATERDRLACLP